jgi:spermidine synthase
MIPWKLLTNAKVPGKDEELGLFQRGQEFSIRVGGRELMNSRVHGSEEALAELACDRIGNRIRPRVLIGGLGLGYTLAAVLRRLGAKSQVLVAELVPEVVEWNRGPLAALAGRPLQDRRVTVREVDVARIIKTEQRAYNAILLDIDNGPEDWILKNNNWLYSRDGLEASITALRPAGVLAVWAAGPARFFNKRLRQAGFTVEEVRVQGGGPGKGRQHMIWIATGPS